MKGRYTRERIREAYLHGERFTQGDRKAEAIRCYAGQWSVFYYVNGKMRSRPESVLHLVRFRYQNAIRAALAFVSATRPAAGEGGGK